jgi:hypothetical protein
MVPHYEIDCPHPPTPSPNIGEGGQYPSQPLLKYPLRLLGMFFVLMFSVTSPVMAESTRVYHGPGETFQMVDWITIGTPVVIHQRNTIGNWLNISWQIENREKRGWVMIGYVMLPAGFKLSQIAVNDEITDADTSRVGSDKLNTLYGVPILPEIQPSICDLYHENRIREGVLSKVGDSNSVSEFYLAPMSRNEYDLGPYDFLADITERYKESFGTPSFAARVGMNTASVLDPLWRDTKTCNTDESPLACEYRVHEPLAALIMFGVNDTRVLNQNDYETNLRQIVEETLAAGVIPILVMFTIDPDDERYYQALRFNQSMVVIAEEYDVPVINFWLAAKPLPDAGVGEDHIHLTQLGRHFMLGRNESFNGLPLHNLLVLHVLDMIHRECQ